MDDALQRDSLELISALNRKQLGVVGDPEIQTRLASYEMASHLQTSAPELMDLKNESKETLELYGCDPEQASFARACLLARRMVERGVCASSTSTTKAGTPIPRWPKTSSTTAARPIRPAPP